MTSFFSVKVGSLLTAAVVGLGLPVGGTLLSGTPANAGGNPCIAQAEINDSLDSQTAITVYLTASASCPVAPLQVLGITGTGRTVVDSTPMQTADDGSRYATITVAQDLRFDRLEVVAGNFFATELAF